MIYHVSIQRRPGVGLRHRGNTDEEFEGTCNSLPVVGKRFRVVGYDEYKYIHTSEVKSIAPIEEDQRLVALIVETLNSIYDVRISHTEGE